jgi:ABC-2 type transport system ATP-binding protein
MSRPVIEIDDLSKFYGKARGIENVSLEISEGEIFGFIGPNGAGKSTTIRILLNLIFPTSGRATIFGMDVTRDTKKIKQQIGYIPSDANVYQYMDVIEFLNYCTRFYPTEKSAERIAELSDLFELDVKRKIADLSMGNRKKVSIIQSLVHDPKLLIMDEPTTGLDPLMQAKLFEYLRLQNWEGMTIFFSSHILSEIQMLCKKVAIIKDGKIVRVEEIEALRKKQLKKVNIEFADRGTCDSFNIAGMETIVRADNRISFMYSGDINGLTDMLAGRQLGDLTIEEPSLEEIFMHYYK